MKKIGIVTYYEAINQGAFLQAYCMLNFLKNNNKNEVGFLKNKEKQFTNIKQEVLNSKNPKKIIFNLVKRNRMMAAQKKYLNILNNERCDTIVIGSDEMWNFENKFFSEYNIASNFNAKTKYSFAVSMGNYNKAIPVKTINEIKKLDKISVRDKNSYNNLIYSGIEDAEIHLDPIFLNDIPFVKPRINKKYILIYGVITDDKIINKIKNFAKTKKLEILSIDFYNTWCKSRCSKSPFEFYGFIKFADLIITNMFHGTMLSIKANKKFVSLLTERRKLKIEYAIELLELLDCCVDYDLDSEKFSYSLEKIYKKEINYHKINDIINNQKNLVEVYFQEIR